MSIEPVTASVGDGAIGVNRVPELSFLFWIIKCLATALGETIADLVVVGLADNMRHALALFSCLLVVIMGMQLAAKKYVPFLYWVAIILISIVGTLVTDIFAEEVQVSLHVLTPVFAALLFVTFCLWFGFEKTLSIHSIFTLRRELWYWLTVLFTFCLGTALGVSATLFCSQRASFLVNPIPSRAHRPLPLRQDTISEIYLLGYWRCLVLVVGIIAFEYLAYKAAVRLSPPSSPHNDWRNVLCFWIAYVLTRPLGASVGDLLTASPGPLYESGICGAVGSSLDDIDCGDDEPCISGVDCEGEPDDWLAECPEGAPTCFTPLACDRCWGVDAAVATNAVFGVSAVLIIAFLTYRNVYHGGKG